MRRVIIESPFAPRTPVFEGGHNGGASHTMCRKCLNEEQRERESTLHARYLAACLHDSLMRGEAPFASHGLYTLPGVLRDDVPAEREQGIKAGFAWRGAANATVCYEDLGWSDGMRKGVEDARRYVVMNEGDDRFMKIEVRRLGGEWDDIGRALRDKYPR